jgi:hypothetical protein
VIFEMFGKDVGEDKFTDGGVGLKVGFLTFLSGTVC